MLSFNSRLFSFLTLLISQAAALNVMAVTAEPNVEGNLIETTSYNFNSSLGRWHGWGDGATMRRATPGYDGSAGCMSLKNTKPQEFWQAQAQYDFGKRLAPGRYRLEFYARSRKQGSQLQICCQQENYEDGQCWPAVFDISTEWSRYVVEFDIDMEHLARLILDYGQSVDEFFLDRIALTSVKRPDPVPYPGPDFTDKIVLEDFNARDLGSTMQLYDGGSKSGNGTATVETDPADSENKVLHVKTTGGNTRIRILMDMTGTEASAFDMVSVRFFRPANEGDNSSLYKTFYLNLGRHSSVSESLNLGETGYWVLKTYFLKNVSNSDRYIDLGFNGQFEYYIDDITLCQPDYVIDDDTGTLRYYADALGFHIGAATSSNEVTSNTQRQRVIEQNLNALVAENQMKFDALEPYNGRFDFKEADKLVQFAKDNGITMRGHNLCWHTQVPNWISEDGFKNNRNLSKEQLQQILKNHIISIVSHYKGQIAEWDVVNECLDDNQSILGSNPDGYSLRHTVWYDVIGESYLDSAFVWARQADPDVLLILNEYGNHHWNKSKTKALFNLAKRMKESGTPIDGVGIQCHLATGDIDSTQLVETYRHFAEIGLKCEVTELDITIGSSLWGDLNGYIRQAEDYRTIVNIALQEENSLGVIMWGVSDDRSWIEYRQRAEPLIFDKYYTPKPAFYYIRNTLADACRKRGIDPARIIDITPDSAKDKAIYDISGKQVSQPSDNGIYIADGQKRVFLK